MARYRYTVVDGDGHVFEDDDELIQHYEGDRPITARNKCLPIFPSLDGWSRGVVHKREDDRPTRPNHTDAEVWAGALDWLGAEASVLFPTAGLAYGLMRDVPFATATAVAYNNWIEARYTSRDRRLYGAALTPIFDVETAVAEVRRAARRRIGMACMLLPSNTGYAPKYGDERYWPIYEEAERNDLPIALHGGPSQMLSLDNIEPFHMVHTMSHPYPLFMQLASIVTSGVFDAFPRLRMVFLEAGCSWVPFLMDRLDYEYESIFGTEMRKRLRTKPSSYMRETENFWVSAELGEAGLKYTIDAIGPERIIYASDYPHEPTEEELLGSVPSFLENPAYDERTKELILGNAGRLYRIGADGLVRAGAPSFAAAAE